MKSSMRIITLLAVFMLTASSMSYGKAGPASGASGASGVAADVRKVTIIDNDLPGSPIIDCSLPGEDCKIHWPAK
ncbi:MAG: hypothetical protein AB8H12_24250 [Lewinella sp.]